MASRRGLITWLATALAACGGTTTTDAGIDARTDVGHAACTTDVDCDDHLYCNGPAVCVVGVGCVAGTPPCAASQLCSEATRTCTTDCAVAEDADGDGHRAVLCGGDDCDDGDANRYPGNHEICDPANHDEDCDATTFGFRDEDGDGYPDATCCNADAAGTTHCGTDCNDANANVHPTQAEVCNHVDDDCNGLIDDGITVTWTVDADGDGHGDATPGAATMVACMMPPGYALLADDCADMDAGRHPGLPEICDGIDNDCMGGVDDVPGGCDCTVGSIQSCGLMGRCAAGTQSCMAGHWAACSIMPVAETCNGIDDDCNGVVDDGLTSTCYVDADDDGYSAGGLATAQCTDTSRSAAPYHGCPIHYTGRAPAAGTTDCCDTDARAFPSQPTAFGTARACGGFDFNCDGSETSDVEQTLVTHCTTQTTAATCVMSNSGWVGAVPACGGSGTLYGDCTWSMPNCYNSSIATFARQCR